MRGRSIVAAAVTATAFSAFPAHALIIYATQADLLASGAVATTETFNELPPNTPSAPGTVFLEPQVVLDGVLYSTDGCTNACWTVDNAFAGAPSNVFVSNLISNNTLSFGTGRYVTTFGFNFVSGGAGSWLILVDEVDGTTTDIQFSGQFNFGVNGTGFRFLGFGSAVGIQDIRIPADNGLNWAYDDVSRSDILGGAQLPDGPITAALPEPSPLLLFGGALMSIAAFRFRRQSRKKRDAMPFRAPSVTFS